MKTEWTAFNSQNGRIFKSWRVQDEFGDIVATLNSNHVDEVSRAQLIAAAPELLEACQELLATGLNGGNNVRLAFIAASRKELSQDDLDTAEESERAVKKARAAIAKATKGQN